MQTHTYTYTYIFDGGKPEQTIFLICKTKWEKKDPAASWLVGWLAASLPGT